MSGKMSGNGMGSSNSGECAVSGEMILNANRYCRCYHNMGYTIPAYLKMIRENSGSIVFNPKFFEHRETKAIDSTIIAVKPIIDFGSEVKLGYNVGTRGNGKDAPKWPSDLMVEVVS